MPLIEEPVLVSMSDDNGFEKWFRDNFAYDESVLTDAQIENQNTARIVGKAAYAAGQASQQERIAELEAALKSVRKDITTCGEIVWRPNGAETTFDYIGSVVNDPVTWDEWEARQIGADDEWI